MATVQINEDNLLTVLISISALLVVVFSIAGWIMVSGRFAAGVAAGGSISLLNFFWLRNALREILQMPAEKATRSANVRYIIRLTATGFILWLLIVKAGLNIFGLILGLSVLVIGIVALTIYRLLHSGG
jgi:hypothetical protein